MAANEVAINTLLWPFRANWRETINTGYDFSTTIFESTSGKEQRRAHRTQPRVEIDFLTTALDETAQHQLDRFVFENQNAAMVVPDYTRVRRGEVTSDTEVAVVGVMTWAVPGAPVVIVSETGSQLRRISAVIEGNVLVTTTAFTLTGAVRVYPGIYGKLDTSIQAKIVTAKVKEVRIDFAGLPGFQIPVHLGAEGDVFDGRPVFTEKVDWKARTHDYTRQRSRIDYGKGRVTDFAPVAFGTRTYKASFLAASREDLERIAGFWFRRMGRLKEFFAPTWTSDLTVISANPGNKLVVTPNGAVALANNVVDRALMIEREDGTRSYHRITALAVVGATQELTVVPNLPVALSPIRVVSWMPLCRFGSDRLSISHRTAEVATFDLSIQTLEYRAASA